MIELTDVEFETTTNPAADYIWFGKSGSPDEMKRLLIQDLTAQAFASLEAIITAAGSDPTYLIINGDVSVSSACVVPSTITLDFRGAGRLVEAGTGTVEFRGPCIKDARHQIFSGFESGDVNWTGPYPEPIRPEWFGALGDNTTDDHHAFVKVNEAMRADALGSGLDDFYRGGTVQLSVGKYYYLSAPWQVNRTLRLWGGSYSTQVPSPAMRWPANTAGIIWHARSTLTGSVTDQTALEGEIVGVGILGAKGGNNCILDTNGLTFTLVAGGAIEEVSASGGYDSTFIGTQPTHLGHGATVTLNGFEYHTAMTVGDTTPDHTSFAILEPRRIVFGNSDGTITNLFGTFPSNNDWAGKTLTAYNDKGRVTGGPWTITSNTTTLITLGSGTPGGVFEMQISGVKVMTNQNARLNVYHGVDVRAMIKMENVNVNGFAGDGIYCPSEINPTGVPGGEPNSNNSQFNRCIGQFNAGSGIRFYGSNSNNITTRAFDAQVNSGHGVFEEGTAGQNHYDGHQSFNYGGGFYCMGDIAHTSIMECYTEGQQPASIVSAHVIVDGGNHGAGVRNHHVRGSTPYIQRSRDGANTGEAWMCGIDHPFQNLDAVLFSFGSGLDEASVANGGTADQALAPAYLLKQNTPRTGLYTWAYTPLASGSPSKFLISMTGGPADEDPGETILWGFRTGRLGGDLTYPTDQRISRLRHATAVLVSGVVTVTDAAVTANTRIFVQRQTDGGTIGCSYSITRSAGTSFTITSKDSAGATQTADTSTLAWWFVEP